jgi:hypothetical protein
MKTGQSSIKTRHPTTRKKKVQDGKTQTLTKRIDHKRMENKPST